MLKYYWKEICPLVKTTRIPSNDLYISYTHKRFSLRHGSRAATILGLLGNETIQFNTRVKKTELDLRKQLNIDVKSTTKLDFSLVI